MKRCKLRPRYLLRLLKSRRLKPCDYFVLLTIAFFTSFSAFTLTLYYNSGYVFIFINYLTRGSLDSGGNLPFIPANKPNDYYPREFKGKSQSVMYDTYIVYTDFNFRKSETLTYRKRTYSNNIEILFRFPRIVPISSLLLIFHSCNHTAYDWFETPERQRIIGAAIDLGYACLAFQSTNNESRCWSNNADIYENKDVQMVVKGLEKFYKDFPILVSLPRYTFGESSGGLFSSILAINHFYDIQGQILFNSIVLPEILYTYVKPKNYPTTVWIHMLRDIEFASEERINVSKQIFNENQILYNSFPIEPIAISHTTFHERIPNVLSETSHFLFYRLQQHSWINFYNYLTFNPRRQLSWKTFLFPPIPPYSNGDKMLVNLNKYQNVISDLLNTIYGEHEISFERSFEVLTWLQNVYLSSLNRTVSIK